MPLYEYKCNKCGATQEIIQKVADPPLEKCSQCGGPLHKVISCPAIQFKGSGWYVTDYAAKGRDKSGSQSKAKTASAKEASGGENKVVDKNTTKPATPAS